MEALARSAQITHDTVLKVFDKPIASYKKKDDLVTIAGAFQLLMTGTNAELIARIKLHLTENPQLEQNHRFTGLFHSQQHGPVSMAKSTLNSLEPTASEALVPSAPLHPQSLPPTQATIALSSMAKNHPTPQLQAPWACPRPRPIAHRTEESNSETMLPYSQLMLHSSSESAIATFIDNSLPSFAGFFESCA